MKINGFNTTDTLREKVGRFMYSVHTNKVALRSQHMIADALWNLMKHKCFQQITVTEICKEAAIGRKTFYRNFETKEDVIDFRLDELCAEFEQENIGKTPEEQSYLYFSFFQKHINCFKIVYQNGLLPILQNKLTKVQSATMPIWSENPVVQGYLSGFVVAGMRAIMQVWVERNFQEDIDQVFSLARRAQKGRF